MSTISTDDVREIIKEENTHVEKTISRLAESVEKMVEAVNNLATQSKVTEEKFSRVNERIDSAHEHWHQANKTLNMITTEILPALEASVAVNSFSANKIWKIGFAITVPMVTGTWALVERLSTIQSDQTKIIASAINNLSKLIGAN